MFYLLCEECFTYCAKSVLLTVRSVLLTVRRVFYLLCKECSTNCAKSVLLTVRRVFYLLYKECFTNCAKSVLCIVPYPIELWNVSYCKTLLTVLYLNDEAEGKLPSFLTLLSIFGLEYIGMRQIICLYNKQVHGIRRIPGKPECAHRTHTNELSSFTRWNEHRPSRD